MCTLKNLEKFQKKRVATLKLCESGSKLNKEKVTKLHKDTFAQDKFA